MRSRMLLVAAIAAFAVACSSEGGAGSPTTNGTVVSQSGLEVTAKVASARLGDEGCGGTSTASGDAAGQGRCAASADAGGFAPSESGGCGGCQGTSVQLAVESGAGAGSAKLAISQVTLLDEAGAQIAKLTPSNPQLWNAGTSTYATWDQSVSGDAKLNVKYTLSAPPWSKVQDPYKKKYRLVVDLTVDGRAMSIQSELLSREAMVAT